MKSPFINFSINPDAFPGKDKVKNAIRKLTQEPFPSYNGNTMRMCFDYAKNIQDTFIQEFGIPIVNLSTGKQKLFNTPIYRVREFSEDINIYLFQEYSYPPPSLNKKMGRCNFPNYPVFYGSTVPEAAILEAIYLELSPKEYLVSVWEINPTEEDVIIQTFFNERLPFANPYCYHYDDLIYELNEDVFKGQLDCEQLEAYNLYLRYLSSIFNCKTNDYSISAALAFAALYSDEPNRTDILLYPSIQTMKRTVNLAIAPNFVNNSMRMCRMYRVVAQYVKMPDRVDLGVAPLVYGKVNGHIIEGFDFDRNNQEHVEQFKSDFKVSQILANAL